MPSHKTKYVVTAVSQMEDAKKVLLVGGGPIDSNLKLATQNIHYVNVLPSIVSPCNRFFFFFSFFLPPLGISLLSSDHLRLNLLIIIYLFIKCVYINTAAAAAAAGSECLQHPPTRHACDDQGCCEQDS